MPVQAALAQLLSWDQCCPTQETTDPVMWLAQGILAEHTSFKLYSGDEYIMDCRDGDKCKVLQRCSDAWSLVQKWLMCLGLSRNASVLVVPAV